MIAALACTLSLLPVTDHEFSNIIYKFQLTKTPSEQIPVLLFVKIKVLVSLIQQNLYIFPWKPVIFLLI